MIREEEYKNLRGLVRAWASFSEWKKVEGAMEMFEAIDRPDAVAVIREQWVCTRTKLGKPVNKW